MKKLLFAPVLAIVLGCGHSSYKTAYSIGAVTKEFTESSYEEYQDELKSRIIDCHPENNPEIKVKSDFDECMGRWYREEDLERIVQGIAIYRVAARALSEILEDPQSTPQQKLQAASAVVHAASEALLLFPGGERLVKKLKNLVGLK